jgi:hypothetical protein
MEGAALVPASMAPPKAKAMMGTTVPTDMYGEGVLISGLKAPNRHCHGNTFPDDLSVPGPSRSVVLVD